MERDRWHNSATVRTSPARQLPRDDGQASLYFSTAQVPAATHPELRSILDESQWRALHVQHLYRFMAFTTRLEQNLVNPVLAQIAQRTGPFEIPSAEVQDAHRIYVDEAYHALTAAELIGDVEQVTGISPCRDPAPPIDVRVRRHCEQLPDARRRTLAMHMFIVVSETMISATLTQIPCDQEVINTVREVVADHAVDEGRHHAYFAAYLPRLWDQLTSDDQRLLAPLLPAFITEFQAPRRESLRLELISYGVGEQRAGQLVDEIHPRDACLQSAAATLRYFRKVGAVDSPAFADSLEKARMLS